MTEGNEGAGIRGGLSDTQKTLGLLTFLIALVTYWFTVNGDKKIYFFWIPIGISILFYFGLKVLGVLSFWWASIQSYPSLVVSSEKEKEQLENRITELEDGSLAEEKLKESREKGRLEGHTEIEGQVLATWSPIPELFTAEEHEGEIMLVARIKSNWPLEESHYGVARKDTDKKRASVKVYKKELYLNIVYLKFLLADEEYFMEGLRTAMKSDPTVYISNYKLTQMNYSEKITELNNYRTTTYPIISKTEEQE